MKSPIKDLGNCSHISNAVVTLELVSWYHFDNRVVNLFLGRLKKHPDHSCNNYLYPIKRAWRLSSGQVQEGFAPGVLQVSQAMFKHSLHKSTDQGTFPALHGDRLEAGFPMGQDVNSHVGTLATVQRLLL